MDLSVKTEAWQGDDQSWLAANHGTDFGRSITLDTSTFTAGTHYPNGYFPSGLPLGRITASGLYGPYNDAASDGTQTLVGFLLTPVKAPAVNTTDVGGALFEHGRIVEANLPVAIDANGRADIAKAITIES